MKNLIYVSFIALSIGLVACGGNPSSSTESAPEVETIETTAETVTITTDTTTVAIDST